ncbi:hypothetical protein C1645_816455 [Glomus cerebriforme]|uniref:Uncharacterized protein n=1 Tax=Glomus cerebriforme TaxID=658196 RepID=A0A397TBK7_9GLOM|nr:hypothetical protein C1645_816455 [Glomus cerebriforme]
MLGLGSGDFINQQLSIQNEDKTEQDNEIDVSKISNPFKHKDNEDENLEGIKKKNKR